MSFEERYDGNGQEYGSPQHGGDHGGWAADNHNDSKSRVFLLFSVVFRYFIQSVIRLAVFALRVYHFIQFSVAYVVF